MIDIQFVLIYLLLPPIVIVLAKTANVSITRISVASIVLIFYFLFAYMGVLPLYFFWDSYRYAAGVTDRNIILQMFMYTSVALIFMVFGFIFIRHMIGLNTNETINDFHLPNLYQLIIVLAFVAICMLIFFIYLRQLPGIALFSALSGKLSEAELLRSAAGNAFSGKHYRYYMFYGQLLPFLTFFLFAHALTRKKFSSYMFFSGVFLLTLFAAVMSIHKGPAARLILGLLFVYLIVRKDGVLSAKGLIAIVGIIVPILVVLYMAFMGVKDPVTGFTRVLSRMVGQIHPAYYYLQMFPVEHEFLYGLSFPNPGGMLPFEPYPLTREVMNYAFPRVADLGIVGSAPTVFWGELYANFGFWGVPAGAFVAGGIIYSIHYAVSQLNPSPLKVALTIWIGMHLAKISGTGASFLICDAYFVLITMVSLLIWVGKKNPSANPAG